MFPNVKYINVKIKNKIKASVTKYYLNKISKESAYSDEDIKELKLKKWLSISRYAVKNIPFYIDVAKSKGFNSSDIKSLEDLNLFPFISRNDVVNNVEGFLPIGKDKSKFILNQTSGSTGKPLEIYESKTNRLLERAYIVEQWQRVGFDPAKSRTLAIRGRPSAMNGQTDKLINYSIQEVNAESIHNIMADVKSYKLEFLHTYPTSLKIFLSFIEKCQDYIDLFKSFKAVLLSSERVDDELIKSVKDKYGVRVFTHYGHTEHLIMGAICSHSNDYHIFPSYGICELVDQDDNFITENNITGEMVGTSFNNFVMPLFRYKTGDYAEWNNGSCKCNKNWQRIKNIQDKYEYYKVFDSENTVFNFSHHYRMAVHAIGKNPYLNILKYQYVQNEPGILELSYIPNTSFSKDELDDLKRLMDINFKNKMILKILKVDDIKSGSNGKLKPLIQNIK